MTEILPKRIEGKIDVPGSKYIANRALLIAAVLNGKTVIENVPFNDDINNCIDCLKKIGARIEIDDKRVVIIGNNGEIKKCSIDVGESGTLLRLMTGLMCLSPGSIIEGTEFLMNRPIMPLLNSLKDLGMDIVKNKKICIKNGSLKGGRTKIKCNISSQFLSSLLIAAPFAAEDVIIDIQGDLISKEYIEMTISIMKHFGVKVNQDRNRFLVRKGQCYQPLDIKIPGDPSSANYFLAAGAITGGKVNVGMIDPSGEGRFIHLLEQMGCKIGTECGFKIEGGNLSGIDVDLSTMPDSVPTLTAVALFAEGKTTIRNIAHLKFKESDRIRDLADELRKLNANISYDDNSITIEKSNLKGGILDPHNDHRLAMSMALIGLRIDGIKIKNTKCVNKSFPGFWDILAKYDAIDA